MLGHRPSNCGQWITDQVEFKSHGFPTEREQEEGRKVAGVQHLCCVTAFCPTPSLVAQELSNRGIVLAHKSREPQCTQMPIHNRFQPMYPLRGPTPRLLAHRVSHGLRQGSSGSQQANGMHRGSGGVRGASCTAACAVGTLKVYKGQGSLDGEAKGKEVGPIQASGGGGGALV